MNEIAARSGVTKKTVYLHFPSKAKLYSKVVKVWMDALPPSPVVAAATGSLREDLSTVAQALLVDASNPFCRRLFVAFLTMPPGNSTRPLRFWLARRARFVRALESLLIRHNYVQPHLAARQFVTLLLGLAELPARYSYLGAVHMPSQTLVDSAINLMLRAQPPRSTHLDNQSETPSRPRKTWAVCCCQSSKDDLAQGILPLFQRHPVK